MTERDDDRGSLLLQFLVLLCLVASATFFAVAWRASLRIGAAEAAARANLVAIARAETELHAATGGYGTIDRLLDLAQREPELGPARRALRERLASGRLTDDVVVHAGYCLVIYLADAKGLESRTDGDDLDRSYYIAYAWPERHGETGRTVFVIDAGAGLRSWENRLPGEYSYSGPEEAPPAQLAPAGDGRAQPFALKRMGPQKSLRWFSRDEESP